MSAISVTTNEKIVINLLKKSPDEILRFDQNYFVSSVARNLFIAIKECYLASMDLNNPNLLIHGNKLDSQITEYLLSDLDKIEVDITQFNQHFKILKKDYAKNLIETKILKNTLSEVSKKGDIDISVLESLKEEITQAIDMIEGRESLLLSTEQLMDSYQITLNNRIKGEDKYPTGDSYLDSKLTMGYAPGQMTTIFAGTGEAKSVFELGCVSKRINKKIPSLLISLENDKIMSMDRLIAMRLGINNELLYRNNKEDGLNEDIMRLFEEERIKLNRVKTFYFVEEPNLSLGDVEILIKEAKRKMGVNYLVCSIDLLTMVEEFSRDISATKIEEAMNELHRIARRQHVHLVNIVQANMENDYKPKTVKDVDKCRPSLRNIKNSKAFGERSRIVISLFRPKTYAEVFFGKESPEVEVLDDILWARIEKQSMGQKNINLKYLFDGSTYRIFRFKE
jgi:replicative DNA helicase